MNLFFQALIFIALGGIMPFSLRRHFGLMKAASVAAFITGGVLGLDFALSRLTTTTSALSASAPFFGDISLALRVDPLAAFFLLPIFFIAPIAALYSFHYLEDEKKSLRVAANYFFFAILTGSMALVALADNLITFALAWELMSLSSFFLVIYDHEKAETRKAGYIYFIFAQAGAMFIFLAFALIFRATGSMDFARVAAVPGGVKSLIFLLALIGFGSKAGIMPLHTWLPRAHPAAPSHVSAIMSGVMIKMGIYGIIRFYSLLAPDGLFCAVAVTLVGAVSGVLGVAYALGQHDLKKLLAYHSVENIGIILLGCGVGMLGVATGNQTMALLGFAGGLLHVLNHALFKSLLFMGAGAVLHRTGTLAIERMGGLLKRMPVCGMTFLVGAIAICGLPPFNGFVSEFLIYKGSFAGSGAAAPSVFVALLAILSLAVIGGLAVGCFTKVVGVAFLGEPRSRECENARPAGGAIRAAMVVVALTCALIGLAPQFFVPLAQSAARSIPALAAGGSLDISATTSNLSVSAVGFSLFLLLLLLLRVLLPRGRKGEVSTWGCGFTQPSPRMQYSGSSFAADMVAFYHPFVLVRRTFRGLHGFFPAPASFHSHTVDQAERGFDNLVARPVMAVTGKLRWLQHGHIQLYIAYIFFAMLGLLLWLVL